MGSTRREAANRSLARRQKQKINSRTVDLAVIGLNNVDRIAAPQQLRIHHVLRHRRYEVGIVAQNAITQGAVGQIELLLRFQQFFTLNVVPRAAVEQIRFLQLLQVAVNGFVDNAAALGLEIIRDGLSRKRPRRTSANASRGTLPAAHS